jgi:hypothetical protein
LEALTAKWPKSATFLASDVAHLLNDQSEYRIDVDKERAAVLREFLFVKMPPNQDVSAKSVGKALKSHIGEPVKAGNQTLILKRWSDPNTGPKGALRYYVQGG